MKKFSFLLLLTFIIISCSSDDSVSEEIEIIPPETKKFVSKIIYESSNDGSDVFNYVYDADTNLISIEKNEDLVSFIYDGNKISRVEVTDKITGEILNYMNYFYNNEGLLEYYEGDYFLKVVKYEYENNRVSKYFRYNSVTDFNNDNYIILIEVFYDDETNNIVEFKGYNITGELLSRKTRSYGEVNNRYFGEASILIDLPYGNDVLGSFNYYLNYNLKAWKTNINTNELELYRESFFENDLDGYCLGWNLVYYNTTTGDISSSSTKTYEYIELEVN